MCVGEYLKINQGQCVTRDQRETKLSFEGCKRSMNLSRIDVRNYNTLLSIY